MKVKCTRCNTVFQAKVITRAGDTLDKDGDRSVMCPTCGRCYYRYNEGTWLSDLNEVGKKGWFSDRPLEIIDDGQKFTKSWSVKMKRRMYRAFKSPYVLRLALELMMFERADQLEDMEWRVQEVESYVRGRVAKLCPNERRKIQRACWDAGLGTLCVSNGEVEAVIRRFGL